MNWPWLRGFGWRLAACLLLFGTIFWAFWAHQAAAPASNHERLAQLRAALEENYLRGLSLASFQESDTAAGDTLNRLVNELKNSTDALHSSLQGATALITPLEGRQLAQIIDTQRHSLTTYQAVAGVLGKALAYDPSADLAGLSTLTDSATLGGRAAAAARGLQMAAASSQTLASESALSVQNDNGSPPVVSAATKQILQGEAACFQQLADQVNRHDSTVLASRQSCIQAYPALRAQTVQNVIADAFSQQYKKNLQAQVPPLVRQLDGQLSRTAP